METNYYIKVTKNYLRDLPCHQSALAIMQAVFHRKNGKPWKVTILLPDFMSLIKILMEYDRLVEKMEEDELDEEA